MIDDAFKLTIDKEFPNPKESYKKKIDLKFNGKNTKIIKKKPLE